MHGVVVRRGSVRANCPSICFPRKPSVDFTRAHCGEGKSRGFFFEKLIIPFTYAADKRGLEARIPPIRVQSEPDARFVTIRLAERRMTFLENYSHRHNWRPSSPLPLHSFAVIQSPRETCNERHLTLEVAGGIQSDFQDWSNQKWNWYKLACVNSVARRNSSTKAYTSPAKLYELATLSLSTRLPLRWVISSRECVYIYIYNRGLTTAFFLHRLE